MNSYIHFSIMINLCISISYCLEASESDPKPSFIHAFTAAFKERFTKKTSVPANSSHPIREPSVSTATARRASDLDQRESQADLDQGFTRQTEADENKIFLEEYKTSAELAAQAEEKQKRPKKRSFWHYWCGCSDGEIFSKSGK